MKWLKIKKYLKIFSVIICSIFIFSNNVFAEEKNWIYNENYIEYLKENIDYDLLKNNTNDLIDYIESNTNYDFIITFFLDIRYPQVRLNVFFFEDLSQIKIKAYDYTSYSSRYSFAFDLRNINNQKFNEKMLTTGFDFNEINEENFNNMFDEMKIKIDDFLINNDFVNSSRFSLWGYSLTSYDLYSYQLNIPLYSSKDLVYDNISDNGNEINIQFNDYLFTNNFSLNELIEHFDILGNKEDFSIPGYKKVVIPADKQYAIISGVKTGRVWYRANPRLNSYYDKSNREWGSIDWPKAITDLRKTSFADNPNNPSVNSLYLYYDFDLSKVKDSQFILIEKYHTQVCNLPDETIEECNNRYNYEQEIWIPDNADIYFSFIDVTPNENGGNDFDFEYKDPETGDINNSHTENDSSPDNEIGSFFDYLYKLLNNFQNGFIYISECFTNFFNELPFMLQAILELAFTIGIVKFIIDLFK